MPVDTWRAAASRHVENFNDVAHISPMCTRPPSAIPDPAPIADYTVDEDRLRPDLRAVLSRRRRPVSGRQERREPRGDLHLPVDLPRSRRSSSLRPDGSDYVQYFADAASPVSARETRVFQVMTEHLRPPTGPRRSARRFRSMTRTSRWSRGRDRNGCRWTCARKSMCPPTGCRSPIAARWHASSASVPRWRHEPDRQRPIRNKETYGHALF